MTDYKKNTGNSATMMIRDTGSTVEFWLNSNNSTSFNHDLPWGYTVNGSTNNSRTYDYGAGDGWDKLGSWTVSTDQTVTFRIFDTGTSAFGGPTTFSVAIDRASAPSAPSKPAISEITDTSMRVRWTAGASNGATLDLWQVARNTSNTTSGATIFNVDTDTVFSGLTPGRTYYWWARTHNAKGYSPWSPSASATTIRVPDAPQQAVVSDPTQTTVLASFSDNGNGGSPITAREIGYGTSTVTGVENTVSYTDVMTITGLLPGTVYHFWTRVQNSAGWSPYSDPVSLKTIAGASITVSGVVRDAVPYVNVGGIWKLARPWGRVAGEWKEST